MRVSVDTALCAGHGQCNVHGPDVFDLDDDGYCLIRNNEVPQDLEQQAQDGAAVCPEQAITVEE